MTSLRQRLRGVLAQSAAAPTLFDVKRAAADVRRLGGFILRCGVLAAVPAGILVFLLLSRLIAARGMARGAEAIATAGATCLALACGGIPLGVALRRYREWAREVMVELMWFMAVAGVAGPLAMVLWLRRQTRPDELWAFILILCVAGLFILLLALKGLAWLKSPVVLAVFAPDTPAAAETLATLGQDLSAERAARWRALSMVMRNFALKMVAIGLLLAVMPPAGLALTLLHDRRGVWSAARDWLSAPSHGWAVAAMSLAHLVGWLLVVGGVAFLRRKALGRRMLIVGLRSCLAIAAGLWLTLFIARLASRPSIGDVLAFVIPSLLLAIPAIPLLSDLKGLRSPEAMEWCGEGEGAEAASALPDRQGSSVRAGAPEVRP